MSEAPPPTDPQPKKARDMTPIERAAALASITRGPPPTPMPIDRKATDMTPAERAAFLAEHRRRFG